MDRLINSINSVANFQDLNGLSGIKSSLSEPNAKVRSSVVQNLQQFEEKTLTFSEKNPDELHATPTPSVLLRILTPAIQSHKNEITTHTLEQV